MIRQHTVFDIISLFNREFHVNLGKGKVVPVLFN